MVTIRTTCFNIRMLAFRPRSVFNRLILTAEKQCVSCELRTEFYVLLRYTACLKIHLVVTLTEQGIHKHTHIYIYIYTYIYTHITHALT